MKTYPVHELELQAWWDETMIYSDQFFDTTAVISTTEMEEMFPLFYELQMIRSSYESANFPERVTEVRQHLLNSMTEVVLSFQAFFAGDTRAARLYMQSAEFELLTLQHKADAMGLSRLVEDTVLH